MARGSRTRRRSWTRNLVVPLVMVLLLSGVAGGSYLALQRYGSPAHAGTCVASGLGTTHRYTADRAQNAALISAVAVDRGLPPRAASIALATAYQESQLRNLDYGDRDSLGLFQQRPSQDWGTPEQIMDPIYATNAFYDALANIPDYETDSINDVAQKVQRSGHPEAYRDHETEGRIYASALTGKSGANLVCILEDASGTASPQPVRAAVARDFSRLTNAGKVSTSLAKTTAVSARVPRGAGATAVVIDPHGSTDLGWALANWAVANAAADGIIQVSYQGRVWDRSLRGSDARTWGSVADRADGKVVVLLAG